MQEPKVAGKTQKKRVSGIKDKGITLKNEYRTDKNKPNSNIGFLFGNSERGIKLYGVNDSKEKYTDTAETTLALNSGNVDRARRYVKFYFKSIFDLYKKGKIDKQILKEILDKNGLTLLFDVVEPLEYMLTPHYDYKFFL